MRIRVRHTLGGLERDARRAPVKAARQMAKAVRTRAEQGNRDAVRRARRTAGKHGKHYPDAFSVEALSPFEYEYGPESASPQGDMSFEYGSRNQPPHLDLSKSADIVGPKLEKDAAKIMDGLFW